MDVVMVLNGDTVMKGVTTLFSEALEVFLSEWKMVINVVVIIIRRY
jgi:hypothetical protein